jgi:hypothetical protein
VEQIVLIADPSRAMPSSRRDGPLAVSPLCAINLRFRVEVLEIVEEADEPGDRSGMVALHACRFCLSVEHNGDVLTADLLIQR